MCSRTVEGRHWIASLPEILDELEARWSLRLGVPFEGDEVSCSWVAPVSLQDGRGAVLKIGMPHMEAADEIAGLRFWKGDGTVQLLEADSSVNAILLERCEPGHHLRGLEETEQDVIIASLLKRLWRKPAGEHRFRSLTQMLSYWSEEVRAHPEWWPDGVLVEAGLQLFEVLPQTWDAEFLLHTDLHAGNVLRAHREPWLVIDAKPFFGDPAYDGTQHLLNCKERLLSDTRQTVTRFAGLLGVPSERLQAWTFARAAVEAGRRTAEQHEWLQLARVLAL